MAGDAFATVLLPLQRCIALLVRLLHLPSRGPFCCATTCSCRFVPACCHLLHATLPSAALLFAGALLPSWFHPFKLLARTHIPLSPRSPSHRGAALLAPHLSLFCFYLLSARNLTRATWQALNAGWTISTNVGVGAGRRGGGLYKASATRRVRCYAFHLQHALSTRATLL